LAVQLVLQVVVPQTYAPHDEVDCAHVPAPSQVPGLVAVPALQLALPHEMEVPG
jgi:hypothetical protein